MGAPFPAFPAGRCVRHSLASGAPHNKTAGWTPGSVKPPRCTRLASVSTALDFGSAVHAHAFALLGTRQSRGRAYYAAPDARLCTEIPGFQSCSRLFRFQSPSCPRISLSAWRAGRPVRPGLPCRAAHAFLEFCPIHEGYSGCAPISAWASSSDLRKA